MTVSILIVDDEPNVADLFRQRFRRETRQGTYMLHFAGSGEETLELLETKIHPELIVILSDINMPGMDGLTLLTELRERQSAVHAIIVSAYGDMTNLRTAMNRGAFDFVTKPVDLNDLEITIRKTLAATAKLREMDRLRVAAERARNNLSRYFSPNMVDLLAAQDEPLGAVRRQTVGVLFVDIVGFTRMAEAMPPEAVVALLRQFHERMTAQFLPAAAPSRNISAMRSSPCSACRPRVTTTRPTPSAAPTRWSKRSTAGTWSAHD